MNMSEETPLQNSYLLQTPQQFKHGGFEEKTSTSARRPRNREVTSRYKNTTPTVSSSAISSSYRFPTPSGDKTTSICDLPSPKRFQSAERRRSSPCRNVEIKPSNGTLGTPSNGASIHASVHHRRPAGSRTESLCLPIKSSSPSTHCELPPPSAPPKRIHSGIKSKDNYQTSDHTLRPSANTAHRKLILEHKSTATLQFEDADQTENEMPLNNINKFDNSLWTGNNAKLFGSALSRSVDFSVDRTKPSKPAALHAQPRPIYGTSRVTRHINSSRVLSQSTNDGHNHQNVTPKGNSVTLEYSTMKVEKGTEVNSSLLQHKLNQTELLPREPDISVGIAESCISSLQDTVSETSSASMTITTTFSGAVANSYTGRTLKGTHVPARFLQDAARRSSRTSQSINSLRSSMTEPELAMASARRVGIKSNVPMSPQVPPPLDLVVNGVAVSPWAVSSNLSASVSLLTPHQSFSMPKASAHRNSPSPSRTRVIPAPSLVQNHRTSNAAAMLTFGAESTKRGKKSLTQLDDPHLHRILHNRLLQWRFVNARVEAAIEAQTCTTEKTLYNVCTRTFELHSSIASKRMQLQRALQASQLEELLSVQLPVLEAWAAVESKHSFALTGSIQALESAMLRLPVSGVKVDTLAIKEAMEFSFDVMNSIENSVNYLLPRAEKANLVISELAHVVTQERLLLEECSELLAFASILQVEENSFRTQLMQLEQERSGLLGHLIDT